MTDFEILDWMRGIVSNPKLNARREIERAYMRLRAKSLAKPTKPSDELLHRQQYWRDRAKNCGGND